MRTILVIDESAAVRGLIRAIVETQGYQVTEAGSCDTGSGMARSGAVDLIILDCMAHGGEGFAMLKQLRASVATATIPVLAMCGFGQCGTDLRQWADAVLIKPFRPIQMRKEVRQILGDLNIKRRNQACVSDRTVTGALAVSV